MGQNLKDLAWGTAGQAAGGLVGAGMGLMLEKHNDKRQIKQQQKLTNMQVSADRNLAQFNQDLQYDMWKKTSYPGQMEQLKKAGLNPGLMYGMGGGGGQTTGGGGASVSGGSAPSGGGEQVALAGMGMQMGLQAQLLKAQKENIEADTKNKETDAAYKGGPQTQNTQADTENKKLNAVMLKYTGQEMKDVYEQVKQPNRGIEADTYQKELEARGGIADNIYMLWTDGKLADKSNAEIEEILLRNAKTGAETRNIVKSFDILQENLKGAKLDNVIKEIEAAMQQETGVDKAAPTWIKILARLFVKYK